VSQPHPPIPEPQPQSDADDPRTQSILLPPSQRQGGTAGEPATGQPLPGQPAHAPFPQPATGPMPTVAGTPQHGYDPVGAQVTGPVDLVPGFGAEQPPTATSGSSAVGAPGAATFQGPPPPQPQPHPESHQQPEPKGPRRSPLAAVQRAGRGGPVLLSLGLAVLGLVLLQLGLALDYGNESLWEVVPTWSAFATLGALLTLVPALGALTGRLPARTAWRAGAAGAVALTAAWVLVALPLVASDRGFWLTAAVGAAGAALWLAPGRTE